ncbi:MAG: GxxExxY protein [Candidatus Doudnabacteria bacterium]|nr:GxxExxY protein [Candidatus Doudnabacteria bacterium]
MAKFRADLLYPELSYQVVGILFDVYNQLGYGFAEKTYQKAIAAALKSSKLKYREQVYAPVSYKGEIVASNYFDFLIDNKLVLEIKKGDRFAKSHIDQLFQYLVNQKLKLGILAYFAPHRIHFKRIVNVN